MAKTKAQKQRELRRDARLLFNLIHDEKIGLNIRHSLGDYVNDVLDHNLERDLSIFTRSLLDGWDKAHPSSRRNVREILTRLKKGEDAGMIIRDFRGEKEEVRADE